MSSQDAEQTITSNSFGTVTTKRVIYNTAKGWFSGGTRTDIPLNHVTAVSLTISRSIPASLVLILIGLSLLNTPTTGGKFIGTIFLVWAALLLWGSAKVSVNTSGQDLKAATGSPWQKSEAQEFVNALHSQLFKN